MSRAGRGASGERDSAAGDSDRDRVDATVEARLAAVLARWGGRLSDSDRAAVRGRIERGVSLGAGLREVRLSNADEPEIVFVPYRGLPAEEA